MALAVAVVLLVSGLGGFATFSSYRDLCRLGRAEAHARLHAESTRLQAAVGGALFVADDLLDRLGPTVAALPSPVPVATLLDELHDLATARPGLAWLSASFPDGRFVGLSRDPDSGELRGSDSYITPQGGMERTYALSPLGVARETSRKQTDYDPRKRDFYKLAVARRTRAWTAPYPFLPSHRTGISRVQPLYAQDGRLLAVLTADFDASGISALLGDLPATRDVVMTRDGAVLACAGCTLPAPEQWPKDRPLRISDLRDPVVTAMAARAAPGAPADRSPLSVNNISYLVDIISVVSLDATPILLVRARDEESLYGPAQAHARQNMLVTALVALIGLGLAFAISSNIARLKRARVSAERAAAAARNEAEQLGSYELLEQIGHGGMGEVYRARHKLLSREAALKLIHPQEPDAGEDLKEAFFLEARRLASLRSIHTVSVYDFGVASDGRYFLAMELLDGLDLDALVRRYGPQRPGRVAAILAQVCDSLAEAHDLGLVHQDIKPANVFLCQLAESLDVVKVLDFGIARAVGPHGRRLSRTEGTPAFMSPEQILGEAVGPLSDLYAVGGLGHFLLTGQPPYDGSSANSIQLAHIEKPIPELAVESPALVQLITRCLAKRPENRPVSARILATILHDLAARLGSSFPEDEKLRFWKEFRSEAFRSTAPPGLAATHVRTARVYTLGAARAGRH